MSWGKDRFIWQKWVALIAVGRFPNDAPPEIAEGLVETGRTAAASTAAVSAATTPVSCFSQALFEQAPYRLNRSPA